MPHQTNIAERLAYGRPLEPAVPTRTPVMPRPTTALIGRILIAAIFLMSGIAKLTDPSGTAVHMEGAGIPSAHALAIVAGIAEVAGGLSILFGFLARIGALGLIVFMILTTLLIHHFWDLGAPERLTQMVQFMKNLAIVGGLSLLVAYGPGRYSIDARLRRPLEP
jgi:putative oxidoreductase